MTPSLSQQAPDWARSGLFAALTRQPPDPLLAVIGMHRADPRPDKIDLGVGVYRDAEGHTPVMRAVKAAERRLLSQQGTKAYLGAEGDQEFTDSLARIAFGGALATGPRLTGVQTPGGTGALRLGAELLARTCPEPTIWLGTPTWPNHEPIFREAGLKTRFHRYLDSDSGDIEFEGYLAALADARRGDVVLIQGCCHNPTGTAFTEAQWRDLTSLIASRALVPFVDLAYQGLGTGLAQDAAGTRALLARVPEALVAYSCDKNFALYRERVGALWVQSARPGATAAVRDTMLVLARSLWSMPPDHGAAAVRTILADPKLTDDWRRELSTMCGRINDMRRSLSFAHPSLARLARQQGLFAQLPIGSDAIAILRERHGVYMPASGRINVAGLSQENMGRFVTALTPFLPA